MLILPRRFSTQRPQGPFVLNRGSLQAQGLQLWYVGGQERHINQVDGESLTLTGAASAQSDPVLGPLTVLDNARLTWSQSPDPDTIVYAYWMVEFATSDGGVVGAINKWLDYVQSGSPSTHTWWSYKTSSQWEILPKVVRNSPHHLVFRNDPSNARYCTNGAFADGSYRDADAGQFAFGNVLSNSGIGYADVRVYAAGSYSDAMAWHQYDPATRWDLYWQPSGRTLFWPEMSGAPAQSPVPILMQMYGLHTGASR